MKLLKPFIVAILVHLLCSCSTTTDTRVAASVEHPDLTEPERVSLSQWYLDSLPLCRMHGKELEDFQLTHSSDLWQRLRSGFHFLPITNQRVQEQLHWYSKHPRYMAQVSERGSKYLYHIVDELEKRNLPLELALIPIVESQFNPFASSPGKASGMWQVIPGTAKMLGLRQNWWYDGRRDVVASTDAALDYLQQLNKLFDGDWLLTLAAYNNGAGNIAKAIRSNKQQGKPTDYWSLQLGKEARIYIPRLLAIKAMIEEPEVYGITLYPVPNRPYFTEVDVGTQINLAQAAQLANISMAEIRGLNPGFSRGATEPNGPHKLVLPLEKAEIFTHRLETTPITPTPVDQSTGEHDYTVKAGDTLSAIAQKHNTTVAALRALNNLNSNTIGIGKTLVLPGGATQALDHQAASAAGQNPGRGTQLQHKVSSGDSLWALGRRYKVSIQQITQWNNLTPKKPIRPGQVLVIWAPLQ